MAVYELIIVGGGAAGMLCAIEAKRLGIKNVLLIEKDKEWLEQEVQAQGYSIKDICSASIRRLQERGKCNGRTEYVLYHNTDLLSLG